MNVAGKTLVVTGAGSGIGRAVTLEAIRRGARVAAADQHPGTLKETAHQVVAPLLLSTHLVDVTDRAAVEELPAAVIERWGAVDGLIHCAGIEQPFTPLADLDYDVIDRVFAVNWTGTLYLAKTFLPLLRRRPEAHLVNVSGTGGFLPVPGQTVYGASKAAVKLFTEGLHAECADTNVRVTVVLTDDVRRVAGPVDEAGDAERAYRSARRILDGMAQNAYRVLAGSDTRLTDRLHPRRAAGLIAARIRALLA